MSDQNQPESLDFPPPAPAERSPEPAAAPAAAPPYPQRPQPVAAKERGGFARGFGLGAGLALGFGGVLLVATALSMVFTLVAGATMLTQVGNATVSTQLTTIWGSGSKTMRAIEVSGAILDDSSGGALFSAGTYGYEIAKQFDDLKAEDAGAVVLLVSSPGGSIGGSRAIADAIERYQERTGQKVFVFISGLSASGGVYSMVPADEIVADHGSLVGSIGVVMGPIEQYSGVVSTTGTVFTSGVTTTGGITSEYLTAGKGKDFGNPWRPITEEERANYVTGLNNEYQNFVSHVAEHRGIEESVIVDELGAFLFDNARAESYGLIDATMGRDEFFRHAATQAGLDPADTRVEGIAETGGLAALLGASRPLGVAPAIEQEAGVVPVPNAGICGGRKPIVFAGDLAAVCGG